MKAFAASIVDIPSSLSSLTSRSCIVRCARSTRPLAAGVFAQMPSMLSSKSAHSPKHSLPALRSQMDPHFMFNTLNSIASLVYDQRGEKAVGMIVGLSELLRRASEDSHRAQVTLQEEVEYLQRYVDIQKIRFGDRLRVSIDIPDELLAMQVPSLLLQPLVENAIKHGVSKRRSGGAVRVAGMSRDGALRLTVYNDGPWEQEDMALAPHRVGLGNLRTRLKILHGDRSNLSLQPAEEGGVEVIVTLPLQEA